MKKEKKEKKKVERDESHEKKRFVSEVLENILMIENVDLTDIVDSFYW